MASITVTIPDVQLPRIIEMVKTSLVTGDAVDLENPTNQEISAKIKKEWIQTLKNKLYNYEQQLLRDSFSFSDVDMT